MGNLLQIVDSIASSPTVLLDLNNESPFGVADFSCDPPPLRYTSSSSMLADGDLISASVYGNRTLSITFDQISASQDAWATSWQTLARLIDQDAYWLKYQPTGATSPVFFRCYRSEVPSIEDVPGATAYRIPTLQIPAFYAARGLRHDVSAAVTVNNDPSNGSNGLFFDITGVRGDIPADCLVWTTGAPGVIALEYAPTAGVYFAQAETASGFGVDTTLAASNDATLSGAGNNYVRTTFATLATMANRILGVTIPAATPIGDYRLWVRVKNSASASLQIRAGIGTDSTAAASTWITDTVTTASASGIQMYDLGVVRVGAGVPVDDKIGLDVAAVPATTYLKLDMARVSGSGNTDVDYFTLAPAELAYAQLDLAGSTPSPTSVVLDGTTGQMLYLTSAGPFTGTPTLISPNSGDANSYAGSLPRLKPNVTNRVYVLRTEPTAVKTLTTSMSVSYWPHYLYVRPAST
jgi:hypothetical protein